MKHKRLEDWERRLLKLEPRESDDSTPEPDLRQAVTVIPEATLYDWEELGWA
jgi:hypothetical protein